LRITLALFLIINLTSFNSLSEEVVDCSLPVANSKQPSDNDIIGLWYYQLSNGTTKKSKACDFKADHSYLCRVSELFPIEKSNYFSEHDYFLASGNWRIDKSTFVVWAPFTFVAFSENSFEIQNEEGFTEVFFKNKACLNSL
jgi:hypothetical protein